MHIISSNSLNYQSFFFAGFEQYLNDAKYSVITRKNYLSDLKHFFLWIDASIQIGTTSLNQSPLYLLELLTPAVLEQFRQSLIASQTPPATINRRFATIRTFFTYCQEQGWITTNPSSKIANFSHRLARGNSAEDQISLFAQYLSKEGASKSTIRNYTSDIKQFFDWIKATQN